MEEGGEEGEDEDYEEDGGVAEVGVEGHWGFVISWEGRDFGGGCDVN